MISGNIFSAHPMYFSVPTLSCESHSGLFADLRLFIGVSDINLRLNNYYYDFEFKIIHARLLTLAIYPFMTSLRPCGLNGPFDRSSWFRASTNLEGSRRLASTCTELTCTSYPRTSCPHHPIPPCLHHFSQTPQSRPPVNPSTRQQPLPANLVPGRETVLDVCGVVPGQAHGMLCLPITEAATPPKIPAS